MIRTVSFLLFFSIALGQIAKADIEVSFIEGAPKDQFLFKNKGQCILNDLVLSIDLSNSSGKLIFDTAETGTGVEVFQPFEVIKGDLKLISSAENLDGSDALTLNILSLEPNKVAGFTIDVDDTLLNSKLGNIRVADTEIKNGLVSLKLPNEKAASAVFGNTSKATIPLPPC